MKLIFSTKPLDGMLSWNTHETARYPGSQGCVLKEIRGGWISVRRSPGAISDRDQVRLCKHYQEKDVTYPPSSRLYNTKGKFVELPRLLLKSEAVPGGGYLCLPVGRNRLAETMRTLLAGFFNAREGGDDYMRQMNSLQEIKAAYTKGQRGCEEAFEQLPESIRHLQKPVMLYDVMISSGSCRDQYTEAIRKYRERFPSIPTSTC